MLSATANARLLKKAVRASNAFLSETSVRISEEGIAIRAVDAGNVCLTDIFIPKEDFEAFKAKEGVIGINVSRLNDVLKAVKDGFVEIDADSKTLKLKAGRAIYSIALIDPSLLKQEPKLPVLDLKAETIVDGNEFKNAVSMAARIADNVIFSAGENGFYMVAEGDTEDIRIDLSEGYAGGERARVMLNLEYLKEIAKVVNKDDAVRIAIGTDLPVRIGIESEFSTTILYFIAPRIEVR
ncbi:DNA polymerase sliding clamp [Archaeoglobales archaeon]|nr:MAG: DNA polymerase sliding clamp [Archaeoglobales archaeon]